jgi:hypothetical protein
MASHRLWLGGVCISSMLDYHTPHLNLPPRETVSRGCISSSSTVLQSGTQWVGCHKAGAKSRAWLSAAVTSARGSCGDTTVLMCDTKWAAQHGSDAQHDPRWGAHRKGDLVCQACVCQKGAAQNPSCMGPCWAASPIAASVLMFNTLGPLLLHVWRGVGGCVTFAGPAAG